MALKTPLCDLPRVEHPIMTVGMGGVSYAELVAAVSNAGDHGEIVARRLAECDRLSDRQNALRQAAPAGVTA